MFRWWHVLEACYRKWHNISVCGLRGTAEKKIFKNNWFSHALYVWLVFTVLFTHHSHPKIPNKSIFISAMGVEQFVYKRSNKELDPDLKHR